jgi:orotate phosphoribosyltransferase
MKIISQYSRERTMLDKLKEMIVEKAFKMSDTPTFKLASGKLSRYYVNCRLVTLDPEGMILIGSLISDRIKDNAIDAIGGPALGAIPIIDAVAMISFQKGKILKPFYVRERVKDHGIAKKIEGNIEKGDRVVIVDDVITTGGSTIRAIECARDDGLEVVKVIALVDREEGGREAIKKHVKDFESLLTMSNLK